MVHDHLLLVLSLLFAAFGLHMLSVKLKISFPILLVLGGLAISLWPKLPVVKLDADLVFLVFLPPLLYEAAWFTSFRDFIALRRAIFLQAFGLVLITSLAVAFVTKSLVPGFGWPLGLVLGGIVSPPDAVAATSILHGLPVPKTAVSILEGESLVNDASSLIVFRFALAAIVTGHVSTAGTIATQLLLVVVGGVLLGLALAHGLFLVHRYLPSTASTDTALTVMTPYLLYVAAERFHLSGVLAVVAGGLYLSARSQTFLRATSRVQANAVWGTLVFVLNGLVFILLGLQLPVVVRGLGDTSLGQAIGYGLLVSAVCIVVRLVWVFAAAYARNVVGLRKRGEGPPWKSVFLIGFAGMRGVVSLASALAVPVLLPSGQAFPQRNLLVFITFVVIMTTLVGQGLLLPGLIRLLRFEDDTSEALHAQARALEARLAALSLRHLRETHGDALRDEGRPSTLLARLESHYEAFVVGEDGEAHAPHAILDR